MTFDDLKFSGRETFKAHRESEDLVIPGETDSWDALAIIINRILREKLDRAPQVFGGFRTKSKRKDIPFVWDRIPSEVNTHKGHLVCIEEMVK